MTDRPDWLSPDADETIRWTGAPRVRRVLPTVAAAVGWIALLVTVAALARQYVPIPVLVAGVALLALPAVATVAVAYLRTTNVAYVLTDRNAYRKDGVLSTHVTRVGLGTVQRTALSKDVWGGIFDYGTIGISTAGTEGVDLRFTDLDDPEPVRDELRRLLGAATATGTAAATGLDGTAASESATGIDAATAEALREEFGALRASATRLERAVTGR